MTIAKPREREVLGHGWAEAECACDGGGRECCTSDCSSDAGMHKPAGNQRVWVVV